MDQRLTKREKTEEEKPGSCHPSTGQLQGLGGSAVALCHLTYLWDVVEKKQHFERHRGAPGGFEAVARGRCSVAGRSWQRCWPELQHPLLVLGAQPGLSSSSSIQLLPAPGLLTGHAPRAADFLGRWLRVSLASRQAGSAMCQQCCFVPGITLCPGSVQGGEARHPELLPMEQSPQAQGTPLSV